MRFDMENHHRRSIRLKGYDYTQNGAYFVTVCIKNRECLLGEVVNGEVRVNEAGHTVQNIWDTLARRFPVIDLDAFVVMPNHIHGIFLVGAGLALPSRNQGGAASGAPTMGDVVRAFKSISAINVNRILGRMGRSLWQRNYYERIVRNEKELNDIRDYIANNPVQWELDRENPATHEMGAQQAAPLPGNKSWRV